MATSSPNDHMTTTDARPDESTGQAHACAGWDSCPNPAHRTEPHEGATYTAADARAVELEECLEGIIEQEDIDRLVQLGVRPAFYAPGMLHPDQRPCPPWCGRDGDSTHGFTTNRFMLATHMLDTPPTVVASMYEGKCHKGYGESAKITTKLEQTGQYDPVIWMALEHWPDGKWKKERELGLRIDDARDLITALTFLVATAEAGEALKDVSA